MTIARTDESSGHVRRAGAPPRKRVAAGIHHHTHYDPSSQSWILRALARHTDDDS